MDRITFGDYAFPMNPETFHQKFVREPKYLTVSGSTAFTGMSALKRTVTGNGYFTGANACEYFKALAALCDGTPRILTHPYFGSCKAYLTCVEMTQEPRENHVAYSFEFRGADEDNVIPK